MLRMKNTYFIPIEKYLEQYLYETFYMPIIAILDDKTSTKVNLNQKAPKQAHNAVSDVIKALNNGSITYINNQFTGKFNIKVSKELSKYATFDKRSKSWKVSNNTLIPSGIKAAIVEISDSNEETIDTLNTLFDNLDDRFASDIEYTLDTPIDKTIDKVQEQLTKDLSSIGITPTLTEEQRNNIKEDYNNSQTLNIKNWNPEQTQRLRDMVSKVTDEGLTRGNLVDILMNEWEVSKNKAKFLARQETSLFLSKFRREQSKQAGVNQYKWSATGGKAGDGRTRKDHRHLHGRTFTYGDPPVTDDEGNRNEPGEDYNCRCVAIPLLGSVA